MARAVRIGAKKGKPEKLAKVIIHVSRIKAVLAKAREANLSL